MSIDGIVFGDLFRSVGMVEGLREHDSPRNLAMSGKRPGRSSHAGPLFSWVTLGLGLCARDSSRMWTTSTSSRIWNAPQLNSHHVGN